MISVGESSERVSSSEGPTNRRSSIEGSSMSAIIVGNLIKSDLRMPASHHFDTKPVAERAGS